MPLMLRRKWLSSASKREVLGILPFRERVRQWLDEQKRNIRSRSAFICTVLTVVALHVIIPLFPPISTGLPSLSQTRSFINVLWPVHAATVGATFIVVFFIIGTVHRGRPLEVVLSNVVKKMYLVPISAFVLSCILSEAISYLLLLDPIRSRLIFQGLQNLLVLDSTLFALTMIAILYIFWFTLKYVRPSEIWKLQLQIAEQLAERAVEQQIISEKAEEIRRSVVEATGLASLGTPGSFKPLATAKRGCVADIDLRTVETFGRRLASRVKATDMLGQPVYGSFRMHIGDKLDDENCVLAYVPREVDSVPLIRILERAIKIRSKPIPELAEFDQAFTNVFERALEAIKGGERSTVKETLEFYKESLLGFLTTTRDHGITHDFCKGSVEVLPPFLDEWKVRERILDDFQALLLRSMATDDTTSYELMRSYPLELMDVGMEHNDHAIFSRAIRCYAEMYSAIEADRKGRVWQDIRRLWAENLGKTLSDMHYYARKAGNNPDKVTNIIRFAQLANRELFLLLMIAADRQDRDMCRTLLAVFSETWNSFWDIKAKEEQFGEMERKAKHNYDIERAIGIVTICGMLTLTQHNHGGWESIIEDSIAVLVQEFEAMPDEFSFTKITNIGMTLGTERGDPQWLWDSLSYVSIPTYETSESDDILGWLRFEDLIALGSVSGVGKLVAEHKITEKEFLDSIDNSAVRPLRRALKQVTGNADRWKDYLGGKGLEISYGILEALRSWDTE